MACRNLCERIDSKIMVGESRYGLGKKYCRTCEVTFTIMVCSVLVVAWHYGCHLAEELACSLLQYYIQLMTKYAYSAAM